jgi:hypothetical protein
VTQHLSCKRTMAPRGDWGSSVHSAQRSMHRAKRAAFFSLSCPPRSLVLRCVFRVCAPVLRAASVISVTGTGGRGQASRGQHCTEDSPTDRRGRKRESSRQRGTQAGECTEIAKSALAELCSSSVPPSTPPSAARLQFNPSQPPTPCRSPVGQWLHAPSVHTQHSPQQQAERMRSRIRPMLPL